MQAYILRRVVQGILAIFVICTVTFALARVSGDPLNVLLPEEASEEQIELIKAEWGLDKPLHMQYLQYLGKLFRGDLGEAIAWPNSTATELIVQRLPNTIKLSALALIVSGVIAFPVGVLVAIKKDTPFDYGGKLFAILGQSAPTFAVGLILMWIFAVQLNIFPTSGSGGIEYIILPALALGYYNVAALMRLTRSSMLEVLDTEYVKLARIKGVPEWKVVWKHCFRNALIVPLTYFGLIGAVLITGSVVIETVFAWPGLGHLVIKAILFRDYVVVQAVVLLFATAFVIINIMVDVLYAYIDPRIRYT
ncbi:MAG: ABC transporter permease [Chloroflexota bacterium]|nr:ABC transporter permease [Chloroflexota bacterium]MDE2683418.1 ABC transporter permease [Chloroflexota bacterium]